jgi:hypothetical protein
MFLTGKEVCNLTGYVRPSAQIRWLQEHGWRFSVNALGKPIVALAELNRHMVGKARTPANQGPDWSALNRATGV